MLNFFLLSNVYLLLTFFLFKDKKGMLNSILKKKNNFLKWVSLNLLEVKSIFNKFNYKILSVFLIIFSVNFLGLMILIPQVFLNNLSVSLIFFSLSMWAFTYAPNFYYSKNKISMPIIGSLMSPSLSFLLSNIELLAHLFRPITLTARLWVNIWVGHLIISVISFSFFFLNLSKASTLLLSIMIFLFMGGFFIFESIIMFLQSFVFSFLLKVFFEENEMNSFLLEEK